MATNYANDNHRSIQTVLRNFSFFFHLFISRLDPKRFLIRKAYAKNTNFKGKERKLKSPLGDDEADWNRWQEMGERLRSIDVCVFVCSFGMIYDLTLQTMQPWTDHEFVRNLITKKNPIDSRNLDRRRCDLYGNFNWTLASIDWLHLINFFHRSGLAIFPIRLSQLDSLPAARASF